MPKWEIPNILTDGDDCYAVDVMGNFTSARDLLNEGLDDANVAPGGFTEVGAPLVMDPTSGHTHDGDDSKLAAFATDSAQGVVKWKLIEASGVLADDFTADLNAGYMDKVLAVQIWWQSRSGGGAVSSGVPDAIHTTPGPGAAAIANFWTNRNIGIRSSGGTTGLYALINPLDASPDEVYLYNEYGTVGGGDLINYKVLLIGVDI